MTRFCCIVRIFFNKILRIHDQNGFIALLFCIFIPILLLGVKYMLDTATLHRVQLYHKSTDKIYKKCAKEAALAVSNKWNPSLSLNQQKGSILRIADHIYNLHPAYHDSVIGNSIPGLERKNHFEIKKENGIYDPLILKSNTSSSMGPDARTVLYKNVPIYLYRHKFDSNSGGVGVSEIYRRVYFLIKKPDMALEDPLYDFIPYISSGKNNNVASFLSIYQGSDTTTNTPMNNIMSSHTTQSSMYYTARVNINDDKLQVSVENDRIKVITDDDISYAIPAECNVDIVLSIPTNAAACNKDNYDASSLNPASPTIISSDTVNIVSSQSLASRTDVQNMRKTPIYQVSQAYRAFLKDNFKYTRGVNVALIPYSGKLSIPPDKDNSWSEYMPNFVSTYFLYNQNIYQAYIREAFLYSSPGTKGSSLTAGYDNWGGFNAQEVSGGYGIMCRGKKNTESAYGNNELCIGDLLSTSAPATYKFRRMNYNPCYLGHANFLSMKCELDCSKYYHNPYFITELSDNVEKVYDLLNVIVPFNDDKNISNFVFLPITWANNLFQSWSNDPKKTAQNTSGSTNGGQLSNQSKNTPGRKKILILLVNKPDFFEHGELTYLGFNNDFSEIPLIESDCIRFDIDYSDNSKYFADGTKYNGSIQGAKKILKYETTSGTLTRNTASGYYETSSAATGKLSFPQKYLLKLVVEPLNTIEWNNNIGKVLNNATGQSNWYQIAYNGNIWMALNASGYIATSIDAVTWNNCGKVLQANDWRSIAYGNNTWMAITHTGDTFTSSDGILWSKKTSLVNIGWTGWYDIQYDNNMWFATNYWASRGFSTDNGSNWDFLQDVGIYFGARVDFTVVYYKEKWIIISNYGSIKTSSDAHNWTSVSNNLSAIESSGWNRIFGTNKYCMALNGSGNNAISIDNKNWIALDKLNASSVWRGLWYGNDKFVACNDDGTIAIGKEKFKGKLQFTNISSYSNVGVTSNIYEPTARQEFYIEPSQISDSKDANGNYYIKFNMNNIRLISAEITNCPYKKIIPNCYLEGTTNGTGTAYISTNVKKPLNIKAKAFPAEGTITFYNDNGIEDNVGTHKIINEQTFVFSGGQLPSGGYSTVTSSRGKNFGNNLSKYKVRYLSEDTKIVSATISSQLLRDYGSQYNRDNRGYKQLILNNGMLAKNTQSDPRYTSPYTFGSSAIADPEKYISYFRDSCISLISYVAFAHESGAPEFRDGDVCWKTYGVSGNIRTYFLHWFWYSYSNTAHGLYTCSRNSNYEGNCLLQMYIKNDVEKTLIPECNIEKNEGIDLLYTNGLNSIPEGNYICFQGDGELHVTVKSIASAIGTIKYTKADVSGIDSYSVTTSDSYTTFTIDPTTHLYEPLSDGTYRIKLDLNNVQITAPQMVDTNVVFEYTKLRLPEMSRTVDFSKNIGGKPEYNNLLISKLSLRNLSYNSRIAHWTTTQNNYPYSEIYNNDIIGDFYFLIEDIGTIPPEVRFFNRSSGPNTFLGVKCEIYNSSGLHRRYQDYYDIRTAKMASFDWVNAHLGGHVKYWITGFTYPINTVLYYGTDGTTLNKYQWQMNQNNSLEIDPNIVCSRVTTDACKKLKQDWENNLRIYVIKYRKQTNYQHKVSGTVKNFGYSYIDQCASDPSYVYDVSNEQNLKDTLQSIADNIKTFARYSNAQNVN